MPQARRRTTLGFDKEKANGTRAQTHRRVLSPGEGSDVECDRNAKSGPCPQGRGFRRRDQEGGRRGDGEAAVVKWRDAALGRVFRVERHADRDFTVRIARETVGTAKGAEVMIERAVFLHYDDDVVQFGAGLCQLPGVRRFAANRECRKERRKRADHCLRSDKGPHPLSSSWLIGEMAPARKTAAFEPSRPQTQRSAVDTNALAGKDGPHSRGQSFQMRKVCGRSRALPLLLTK